MLVGSTCTVTEDNPGAPVSGDRSYTWSTQTPDPTTVGKAGATATVVNTLNRAEGSFNIAKSVDGGTAGTAFPAGADFGFSYTCTPSTGDPISGTLNVNAGDSKAPGDAIPGGSTCTVTEGDFPGTLDPYRWDGVSLSVSGDAGHAAQDGRSITFTTTDDAQPVSVRVVNSISAKTAQVVVSKKITGETGGYTAGGDAIFPVTLTCTGAGAQGTGTVAADGSTTFSDIPLGATCTATEGSTTAGLRDGSYAWEQPDDRRPGEAHRCRRQLRHPHHQPDQAGVRRHRDRQGRRRRRLRRCTRPVPHLQRHLVVHLRLRRRRHRHLAGPGQRGRQPRNPHR